MGNFEAIDSVSRPVRVLGMNQQFITRGMMRICCSAERGLVRLKRVKNSW